MKLDDKVKSGDISEIEKYTIIAASNLVVGGLTKKYSNIQEGVSSVMGGKVIDYEAKDIYNQGKSEGLSEGLSQGLSQGVAEGKIYGAVETMREFEIPDSQIAEKIIKSYNLTPEQANIYLAESSSQYGDNSRK